MRFQYQCAFLFVNAVMAHSARDVELEDADLSLPDLEKSELLDAPSWTVRGSAEFKNGRILLTSGASSNSYIYNDYELAYDSWTIESVFRSMGSFGKTASGLSLNLVKDHISKDSSFYGSASQFEGLKVIVDSESKEGSSVHAFLNDGTVDYSKLSKDELYDHSFGSCLLQYQESQVPTTLRISSYAGVLLIQVDNKVCIQTKKIKLPKNYKVGISALTSKDSQEIFELFRLKTYGGIISEVLENKGKTARRADIIVEKINIDDLENREQYQVIESNTQKVISPKKDETHLSDYLATVEEIQQSNGRLLKLFGDLDAKIEGLSALAASSGEIEPKGRPERSHIAEQAQNIQRLAQTLKEINEKVTKLDIKLASLDTSLRSEIGFVSTRVDRLQSEIQSQLREDKQTIVALNRNVEYLVQAEKDNDTHVALYNLVAGLKYLMIPILLISSALTVFTYSLRHEIKRKLL